MKVYLGSRAVNCRRLSGSVKAKESQVTGKPSRPFFLEFSCCLTGSKSHQHLQSAKLLYSSLLILVGRKDFSFTSVGLKCSTVKWKINLKHYQFSQILAYVLLTGDFPSSAADLHLTLYFLPLQFLGFKKPDLPGYNSGSFCYFLHPHFLIVRRMVDGAGCLFHVIQQIHPLWNYVLFSLVW